MQLIGENYIDFKINNISKSNKKSKDINDRLLTRLRRKEKRFAKKLKETDSSAYNVFLQDSSTKSFDSLRYQNRNGGLRTSHKEHSSIDSLRKIRNFISAKYKLRNDITKGSETQKIVALDQKLAQQEYIDEQVKKRREYLDKISKNNSKLQASFSTLYKDIFYSKERLAKVKQYINEPSSLEKKALEYLQGVNGFEEALSEQNHFVDKSSSDLETLGFQTKNALNKSLINKFGANLSTVSNSLNKQVGTIQEKISGSQKALNEIRGQVKGNSLSQNNSFKINPVRCLPFRERLVKQYSFQTQRPTNTRPSLLELSGLLGFKHSVKLSYGIGVAMNFGLGQSWNAIKFTFQGVGGRAYTQWDIKYGFSLYAGYERMYKSVRVKDVAEFESVNSPHNTEHFSENLLMGIVKSYKINNTWNGGIQILYDVWWKEKGLRSPVILRFNTTKNSKK